MSDVLPFPVHGRLFSQLNESERSFFCGDDGRPLHPHHAAQIRLLEVTDSRRVVDWAEPAIPREWPGQSGRWNRSGRGYRYEESLRTDDCWNDEAGRARVRAWLYARGVPFRRTVYLWYDRDRVVETNWRILVRFWDSFAWSVGYAMVAFDHTLRWSAEFHHEQVITFGTDVTPGVEGL